MVFKPVIALSVLDTDESIPPDIPITNDCALLGILSTYVLIQFEIYLTFSEGIMIYI
jgi:hypothetical protein